MERYRPVILLSAAIIIALVTSIIAYNWLKSKKAGTETANLQTHTAAVAVQNIPWGAVIKPEMVKTVPFTKGSLPDGAYFTDASAVSGRVVVSPINANEPILESRLAPIDMKTGGVAAVVDPKKRAMAVKVDSVIGVSGFIYPGNRVDVLVTVDKPGSSQDREQITKIVLQNIPVLATGVQTEERGKDEKPRQVDVITLELTPEEAEKLAHSTTQGKVQLALRNAGNTDQISTNGVTIPALLSGYAAKSRTPARARSVAAVAHPATYKVEILKGAELTTKTFRVD